MAEQAKGTIRSVADSQKTRIAERLGGVAEALRETAHNLELQDVTVGRYAGLAAGQIERISQALNDRQLEDLVRETEAFARRQPLLFVGGAMAAGFLVARLIRNGDRQSTGRTAEGLADQARDTATEAGRAVGEAAQQVGRQVAEAVIGDTAAGGQGRPMPNPITGDPRLGDAP